jgi:diguanylate cyclase (GGDEF)-like protein
MPDDGHRRLARLRDVRRVGAAFFWFVLAVALTMVIVSARSITGYDVARTVLLTAVAMLHAEAARNVERIRRRQDAVAHVDLNSTWTFAATLVLPLPLTAAVIALIYVHVWFRVQRTPPYQRIFNVAMYVLAAAAGKAVFHLGGTGPMMDRLSTVQGGLAVLGAAAGYTLVNLGLLTAWLALARLDDSPFRTALGTPADNALESATLCLGVFVAIALDHSPMLVIIGLPLVLILHRNELVHQLEELARTDTKTGLLNATAWADRARDRIGRAPRRGESVGVLLLDLDLFKKVNDTYGHLAGDDVLREVSHTFKAEVRASDSVGRFGGEEFVVLLPDITVGQMMWIAERIRRRVENLRVMTRNSGDPHTIDGLSVSIGAAAFPTRGQDLDQLLEAADKALYRAKSNGRNQVQLAPPLQP